MQPIATRLNADAIEQLSRHFASQSHEGSTHNELLTDVSAGNVAREAARELILKGDVQAKIPACLECHDSKNSTDENYPHLAGLSAAYIAEQLELYANESRSGGRAEVMQEIAEELDAAQRSEIAAALAEAFSQRKRD